MRRTSAAERERLHETFAALCRIESPSGRERSCADWITSELRALGLEVEEDGAGPLAGADAGNLLTRIPPPPGGRSIMLCAHMDTVPLAAPVEPVLTGGGWQNANPGILGADNKAAVAVLVELARRAAGSTAGLATGVELVFTVCEENGLHGAKHFDASRLQSEFGYVFDHATPIGEIVLRSPTYQRFQANLLGRAAHAGIRPELGRSAIIAAARAVAELQVGRLDADTTCNVGLIEGGTASNVVAERCRVEGEVRSLQDRRVEAVLTELIDHFQDAADRAECDLDITVERMFSGYRTNPRAPGILLAERALSSCGYTPRHISTGGGSDANAFEAHGFSCINLANGTERNHEPGERVSADALEGMLEVAIALVEECRDMEEAAI